MTARSTASRSSAGETCSNAASRGADQREAVVRARAVPRRITRHQGHRPRRQHVRVHRRRDFLPRPRPGAGRAHQRRVGQRLHRGRAAPARRIAVRRRRGGGKGLAFGIKQTEDAIKRQMEEITLTPDATFIDPLIGRWTNPRLGTIEIRREGGRRARCRRMERAVGEHKDNRACGGSSSRALRLPGSRSGRRRRKAGAAVRDRAAEVSLRADAGLVALTPGLLDLGFRISAWRINC